MFHILMGFSTGRYEIQSHLSSWELMKLLVALEWANTSCLAVACADLNNTGIHIDQYLLLYMLIFNALAPAAGIRHEENPPSCQTWCWWNKHVHRHFHCTIVSEIFLPSDLLSGLYWKRWWLWWQLHCWREERMLKLLQFNYFFVDSIERCALFGHIGSIFLPCVMLPPAYDPQ